MIPSTSPSDRTARPDSVLASGSSVNRLKFQRPDLLSTDSATALHSSLVHHPEIRPEMVARARALAADPAYPSVAIMRRVAQQIIAAPDLSEDES